MKKLILLLVFITSSTLANEVPNDPFEVQPLLSGMKAPAFELLDAYGSTHKFDPDNLDNPALLIFYRGGWCPYCMLYWAQLRKAEDDFAELGIDLIFLSADKPEVLAEAVSDNEKLNYALLSDASMQVATAYGIAFKVDDETIKVYQGYGINLETASGYQHHILPAPAAFLIGTDGIIKFQYVNPDYKIRLHPDVLLAAAKTMLDYKLR